jgi:hypothetical protein
VYALILIIKAIIRAGGGSRVSETFDIVLIDVDHTDVRVGILIIVIKLAALA